METNLSNFIEQLENYTDSIIKDGEEPLVLAAIQEKIKKYRYDSPDPLNSYIKPNKNQSELDEAIGEMMRSRTILEMLLVRSFETYRSAKYLHILSSTLNIIKCYLAQDKFCEIIQEIEQVNLYVNDALETAPDDFNTISVVCDLLYHKLYAKLKLKESVDDVQKELDEYIPFLIVAADKSKYKYNAILLIGQIGDIYVLHEKYREACRYYPKAIEIMSQMEELDDTNRREFAIFIGHYNAALMNCQPWDRVALERNLRLEETTYEQLHSVYRDTRSKMDLAIAYSHMSRYHEDMQNYKQSSDYQMKKLQLILETFQIDDNSSQYAEEARLDSFFNSMQPIINYALLSDNIERVSTFKKVYFYLQEILRYVDDIRILQFSNAFAMEIFKTSNGYDDKEAETYLFKKISALANLLIEYGAEDGIIADLRETVREARPFVSRIGEGLQENNRQIWEAVNEIA